jgi:MFS family permease
VAGTFSALRLRGFRVLWISTLLSFLAFFMSTTVQSVVAYDLTHRNGSVGSVVAAQGLAMLVLGPLGGAMADRVRKRRLIAGAQVVTATVFLLLALSLATGTIRVEYLALGSLVMGATFAFLGPARQALTVDLVPAESRGNALALTQVGHSGTRVLGPTLAGLFLGWQIAGATGAYLAMARTPPRSRRRSCCCRSRSSARAHATRTCSPTSRPACATCAISAACGS